VEVDADAGVELFYYFVRSESESGAASDVPFLFWLTGGDRCSVFSGLAYEIGKIRPRRRV
jgi:carboxypeptidase C (cathepsin A)